MERKLKKSAIWEEELGTEDKESDVYSDEGVNSLLEEDEIEDFEAAFMEGYNESEED